MITSHIHKQVFIHHLFMTTQNTSRGKKPLLCIEDIKAVACSHLVAIPCQTESAGALPKLSMIYISVKLSRQIPVKLMLKKLLLQTSWSPPPMVPYFHRILYSSNQTNWLKGQNKYFLLLSPLPITKVRAEHLPRTSGCPKTLDKSSIYTNMQFKHVASVMYPGHITHARQLIWAQAGHLLSA